MKPLHQVLIAAGLLLIAAGTWWALTRPKPQADWVRVEAPSRAALGETVTLRITPHGLAGDLLLNADFHGTDLNHRPLRVLSHGRPQRVGTSGLALEFKLSVPGRTDLADVHAIIYVSPTGRWSDRVRVAKSEPIPVKTGAATNRELHPLRVHEHTPDPETPRVELPGARGLLVMLWLVVAGVLAVRLKQTSERNRQLALIMACLAIVLSEILLLESTLAQAARQLALKHGLYDGRILPQQIAIVVAVVAVAALAIFILFKARNRRLVLGLLAHSAIATAAILSLHEIDALLYATLGGTPVEQLAKLAAVSLSLWGLQTAAGRSTP